MEFASAASLGQLARLAKSNNPKKRDELMIALGSLCAINPVQDPGAQDVFGEILVLLNDRASEDARMKTSNILCEKPWAPRPLILKWAYDIIPVANPVLLKSPVLTPKDLVAVTNSASMFHRLAIAARPQIGEPVTGALAGLSEPEVLTVMIGNDTADMNVETFATCVRVSRRHPELRQKLSHRPDTPRSLLPSLFAYSSKEERLVMAEHLGVDADNFSQVVKQAVLERGNDHKGAMLSKELEVSRLVNKLAKSDRLRPSVLVKAASEENTLLFEHAIAHLVGISVIQFREALEKGQIKAFTLACKAAGIDRSIFPTLYRNLHECGFLQYPLSGDNASLAAKTFAEHSVAAAAVALRLMVPDA